MSFEEITGYAVAALVGLAGLWGIVKKVVAASPSSKDDEAIAKVAPHVDKVVNVGERLAGRDLDGDGDVNDS